MALRRLRTGGVSPRREPTKIAAVVDTCLDRVLGTPGASAIWRVWSDAVGAGIARRAEPVRLRGRTLVVAVSSAPWMQELSLLKRNIVAALNDRLPRPLVEDLFLVLTEGRSSTTTTRARRHAPCPPPPANVSLDHLPPALRASFDDVLAAWRRRARST
jgi:predicted nucleic acid-binding Zn ribbon protein